MTSLAEFNSMTQAEAASLLRPCLDVDRWIEGVAVQRPYPDLDALLGSARTLAQPLRREEIDSALAHHPRIGETPAGSSREADLSRREQATLDLDGDVEAALAEGNRRYEERFERVFLIRAAGRTSGQILDQLDQRLGNDDETEDRVVGDQLLEIALLRLNEVVT